MTTVLSYCRDFNNKLSCNSFADIRPKNEIQLCQGGFIKLITDKKQEFDARIDYVFNFPISELNDPMSLLVFGYKKQAAYKILFDLWGAKFTKFSEEQFSFFILSRVK